MDVTRDDLPFKNLVITGFLGVGKTATSIAISNAIDVDLFDVSDEIELEQIMSIAKIREQFGDTRLKKLEYDKCREAALRRREVIVVPGAAVLDGRNYRLLEDTSVGIVCLTCELGEAMRRLHLSSAPQFRDKTVRGRMMGRIRREYAVVEDERLLQLDTTHMPVERQAELLVDLWVTGSPDRDIFRQGPGPRITPPDKRPTGISAQPQTN